MQGNFLRAEQLARQARELSQKAGDKRSEAMAMVYLGAALSYQGRVMESLDVSRETLVVARESGDKKQIEQALNNLGSITGGLGRYEESIASFYSLHDLAQEINDPVMQYMSLLNLGEAYTRSGEPDRAEDPLLKALKLAGELDHGDPASRAKAKKGREMALLNLAGMEMARGRYAGAFRYFEQVHESQPATPLWAIAALQGMANADQQLGKPQQAIPLFEQAIALAEKSPGGGYQIATITSNLAVSQEATGERDAALTSQQRALDMFHAAGGSPEDEWQVESHIGHVLHAMGHNEEALQQYQEAIAGFERLRSVALNTEAGRAGLMVSGHDTYTETADLLVELHRESDAFAMAERGRARAFLDMLAMTREGLPNDLTPEQASREQKLLARISSAQTELLKSGTPAKEQNDQKAKLSSAEEELEAFQVEVRRSNPRYARLRYPQPIDIATVQRELLDEKTVLLEFLLGEKRSLVWAVSRDQVTVRALPPRKQIEQQVSDYRKLLSDKASVLTLQQSQEKIGRAGTALYMALLAPAHDSIPGGSRLIIIPDGALDYLPFETLVTGIKRDASGQSSPQYALERFSISYGPSAS
ncbi:MAG TPA: tetratricopeptide repeat protein, partial [Acidobacteriaceae bacterium]|nr:tetratricopeptide repeat protein [Acidobacteriaceae bacterium]